MDKSPHPLLTADLLARILAATPAQRGVLLEALALIDPNEALAAVARVVRAYGNVESIGTTVLLPSGDIGLAVVTVRTARTRRMAAVLVAADALGTGDAPDPFLLDAAEAAIAARAVTIPGASYRGEVADG